MPKTDVEFLNGIAEEIGDISRRVAQRRVDAKAADAADPLAAAHLIEYHLDSAWTRARWAAKARAKAGDK
jgi:hypothetical protein